MRVSIQKWGNSLAVRIPKAFAQEVGVREGSVVEVSVANGRLVAKPVGRAKVRIADLLQQVTPSNLHGEVSTGPAVGRESW